MGSLGGVRSIHECLCLHVRTVFVLLTLCFDMSSLDDAPIVLRTAPCLSSHAALVHVQCLWDVLGDAPIVPACVGSHAVLVPLPHLA